MIKLFLLLASWLITAPVIQRGPACKCGSGGPFLTVAPKTALVALVKANSYNSFVENKERMPLAMNAEILDIYRGKETRKQVTIWGDNGMLCRPYISTFKEGNYYIIAMDSAGLKWGNEKTSDYFVSICGTYWLNVDSVNKVATGKITEGVNFIRLEEVRQQLIHNDRQLRSTDQDH